MNTKSFGCLVGLFVISIPLFASEGAEGRRDENALPALPGYSVKVWTKGTSGFTNPDSIEWDRGHSGHIWVGYQNVTSKTDDDGKFSTVVEYDSDGRLLRTFAVPGHCDGLRIDPATHKVWASSNEDGNPGLVSIDQTSGTITTYLFDQPTAHGGGFDDMAFLNGKMFIAASSPTLDANGVNVFPAVDEVTFTGTKVVLTPVLNSAVQRLCRCQVAGGLGRCDGLTDDAQPGQCDHDHLDVDQCDKLRRLWRRHE
jgi:hypothetical protein